MNFFEGIRGRRPMKVTEGEKSSGGSELSVSERPEGEGSLVFTDGKDSIEKPIAEKSDEQLHSVVADVIPDDSERVNETQIKELEASIVREFSIISLELDRWSETLEKKEEIALYDKLYEKIEEKRIEWNTLNDRPLEPGEEKDVVTENIRLLEVFEDLRLIVNTMPSVVREAITKAQGEDMTEESPLGSKNSANSALSEKRKTAVGTTEKNIHLSDEMTEDARGREELYDFLDRPKGQEAVDMLGNLITTEWKMFDQKVSEEVQDKKVFASRNERARLWQMFFMPQMKAMITEYLERYHTVPRKDSNKIFRALIKNLEESATRNTQEKYD